MELGQIMSTLEDRIKIQSDPASWRNYLKNIGYKSKRIYTVKKDYLINSYYNYIMVIGRAAH